MKKHCVNTLGIKEEKCKEIMNLYRKGIPYQTIAAQVEETLTNVNYIIRNYENISNSFEDLITRESFLIDKCRYMFKLGGEC